MTTPTQQVPESLIYEEFGGRIYYRKGYRQVLLGLKNRRRNHGKQYHSIAYCTSRCIFLKNDFAQKTILGLTNEAGLHLRHKENLSNDIVIVEKNKLTNPLSDKYSDIPPKFIIEVDIKIDPKEEIEGEMVGTEMDYILEKSGQLLDFGVEGIAWILTKSRRVVIIKSHRNVEVYQWSETVPLFDDYTFCLQQILEDEDILPVL
ncbi:MAG: hypothetical protein R2822_25430 [Spirosomataceae bacterium]